MNRGTEQWRQSMRATVKRVKPQPGEPELRFFRAPWDGKRVGECPELPAYPPQARR